MLRVPTVNKALQALIHGLSVRDLFPLGLAVFMLFSVLGPVTDLLGGVRVPIETVVRNGLFSGVLALGYAYGSMRPSARVLAVAVAVQVAWIVLIPRTGRLPPDRPVSSWGCSRARCACGCCIRARCRPSSRI